MTRVALVGAGVIGGGWAGRLVENGLDVVVYDPAPGAEERTRQSLAHAERSWARLTMTPRRRGSCSFAASLEDAVHGADVVQESVPEDETLKRRVLAEIEAAAPLDALLCSSTSGLLPSRLQAALARPERFLVGHPFNPVYLLPLVEVVPGEQTSDETVERALAFYTSLGMKPLLVRAEIEGFVADRLLEALWREALWLVHDGVATAQEVDDAIRYGPGLRWAQMGTFLTYRIAGGEQGMRHFLEQFGPALRWPWTKLVEVPELTQEFVARLVAQSDEQAGGLSIAELEELRDDNLVALLQALRARRYAAGAVLHEHEARLLSRASPPPAESVASSLPLCLYRGLVDPSWLDYNGHLTEARYLDLFAAATDALLRLLGLDADYLGEGASAYTVETHLRYLREVGGLEPIEVETQVLGADEKRLHLFHTLLHGDTAETLATGEHLLVHVDTRTGRVDTWREPIASRLAALADAHATLPAPEGVGRAVEPPPRRG
jgi:carnitine 3-dehydrogenase